MSDSAIRNKIVIPSVQTDICSVCSRILSDVKSCSFSQDEIFGIHLAMEEALINAVKHGNKLDKSKAVKIEYSVTPDKFDVLIEDEGPGFKPCEVPDPRDDENLYKASGRGVLLMRAYMDKVEYLGRGNLVHMCKSKNGSR